MTKTKDIKKLSLEQLRQELTKTKKELNTLRMGQFSKSEKDVHLAKKKRKQIAKILTTIREKKPS